MDNFKFNKHIGPGGAKCRCCVDGSKKELARRARARIKAADIKAANRDE